MTPDRERAPDGTSQLFASHRAGGCVCQAGPRHPLPAAARRRAGARARRRHGPRRPRVPLARPADGGVPHARRRGNRPASAWPSGRCTQRAGENQPPPIPCARPGPPYRVALPATRPAGVIERLLAIRPGPIGEGRLCREVVSLSHVEGLGPWERGGGGAVGRICRRSGAPRAASREGLVGVGFAAGSSPVCVGRGPDRRPPAAAAARAGQ